MNADTRERYDPGFLIGVLTGTVIGAGLAVWFAPRVNAELRERVAASARDVGNRASERYREVTTRLGVAVDDLTAKGQNVRDQVADAVVLGANEVARQAAAIKTDRSEARKVTTPA